MRALAIVVGCLVITAIGMLLKWPLFGTTLLSFAWGVFVGTRMPKDWTFFRTVREADCMPRFYGYCWRDFMSNQATVAPVPFNVPLRAARGFWHWVLYGWRSVPIDPRAAFAAGVREGRKNKVQSMVKGLAYGDFLMRADTAIAIADRLGDSRDWHIYRIEVQRDHNGELYCFNESLTKPGVH